MRKLLLFTSLLLWGCNQGGMTAPDIPSGVPDLPIPIGSEGTTPTMGEPDLTECEIIKLNRSSIKSETSCVDGVRFFAEAAGATYFNVHIGGLNNGPVLGPNAIGQWSKWYSMSPGKYTYTLAAETRTDEGIIQCDHHNKAFEIPKCPTPPECPSESRMDITISQRQVDVAVLVDGCPTHEFWTYEATFAPPGMVIEINAPGECVATGPTTGSCKTPVTEETQTRTVTAVGKVDGMICARASDTITIEGCEECRACEEYKFNVFKDRDKNLFIGDAPPGMYYTINGQGHYHDGQIVPKPVLKCEGRKTIKVELFDEHCTRVVKCKERSFTWVGKDCPPRCANVNLTPGCYPGNIDTVAHFVNYFNIRPNPGIFRIRKMGSMNRSCFLSPIGARWAVVKGGPQFRLYVGVKKGQRLCTYCPPGAGTSGAECKKPNVSHVSYFGCRNQ